MLPAWQRDGSLSASMIGLGSTRELSGGRGGKAQRSPFLQSRKPLWH
jgi:hypothetical protein|eukprot:COSAG01_NODE_1739_length_9360_cov_9.910485_5_plen_47_part_00